MIHRGTPIRRKLMAIILMTSCAVLLVTGGAFFAYELVAFRNTMVEHILTVGRVIADNSNAALTFKNHKDADEVLNTLKAEPHIIAACLYDAAGNVFETYPPNLPKEAFPRRPERDNRRFNGSHLVTFQTILNDNTRVGTLYLNSDTGALYERVRPYGGIALLVMAGSLLMAYFISNVLQRQISQPVLALAETAKAVSERRDYSVRAPQQAGDEFGLLTDAFNNMLEQIHQRDLALQEAQEKLKVHADDLEKRVAERTARLSETIAELESFSYSISHDMRAPLRAMQGYSTFVLAEYGGKLGAEGAGYLERISRAGKRLDNLVQDILTYSRMARTDLELRPVDLDKLVEDIVQQYPGLQPSQAEVTVKKPLQRVMGHEASLTQVISNLLGNAVKFIRAGQKPCIKLWTEPRGEELRIWVEDNGIGIAAKDLNRIFGIFERVYPDKTYEGTGIGLSIVRKGVERMGGTAGVESELGNGSKFWIQLKGA